MKAKRGTILIVVGVALTAFGLLWLFSTIVSGDPSTVLPGTIIAAVPIVPGVLLSMEGLKRRRRYSHDQSR